MMTLFKRFGPVGLFMGLVLLLAAPASAQTDTVPVFDSEFSTPTGGAARGTRGLFVGGGRIYVADAGNNQIVSYLLDGTNQQVHVTGLNFPEDVTQTSDGYFWVVNRGGNEVRSYDSSWTFANTITGFNNPIEIETDSNDNLYITDFNNDRVAVYGTTSGTGTAAFTKDLNASGTLQSPVGLAIEETATDIFVYVTEWTPVNRVRKINEATDTLLLTFGNGSGSATFSRPLDVTLDRFNRVYISENDGQRIAIFDDAANYLNAEFDASTPSETGTIVDIPRALVLIDDNIYITDSNNRRVLTYGLPVCAVSAPTSVNDGATFTATVGCNEYVDNVQSAAFDITYNTSDLTAADAEFTGIGIFDDLPVASSTLGSGTGDFDETSTTGTTGTAAFDIAEADFEANPVTSDTDTTIDLPQADLQLLDNVSGGQPVNALAEGATITILNVNDLLVGSIEISSDGSVDSLETIIVTISGDVTSSNRTVDAPSSSGNPTITLDYSNLMPNSTFDGGDTTRTLTVSLDHHIDCEIDPFSFTDNSAQTDAATLLAGDVDNDNNIDNDDANQLIGVYGSNSSNDNDINNDGLVDIFDLVHVGRNLNATAPTDCQNP